MPSNEVGRGQLIFDERDNPILRQRVRRNKLTMKGVSAALFALAFIPLVILWIRPENAEPWGVFLFLWFLVFILSLAVIVFLASLGRPHILLFENGIEFYGGFLSKREFVPFELIVKEYTHIYDGTGIKTDYVVLEFGNGLKKRYWVVNDSSFINGDRFLDLIGENVRIDSNPIGEKKLTRELRTRGVLRRFEELF